MTPVWAALTADKGAEPVTEVIQRGIKQRLLKYLARVSRENRTPPSQRLRLQPTLSLRQQPLTSSSCASALTATSTVANLLATAPA